MNTENNPCAATDAEITSTKLKIHTKNQLLVATFCGSLFCSAYIVGHNYAAIGKVDRSRKVYWSIFGISALIMTISMFIPGYTVSTIISIASLFVVANYYKTNMASDCSKYISDGGKIVSNWKVFGLIIFMLITLIVVFGVIFIGLESIGVELPD